MKARRLNSSSVRNSLAYVMRAKRIASPGTGTRLSSLDTVERISKGWDAWGNRKIYVKKEYDKLQYILAYSNLEYNVADTYSLAKGRAVTAENLLEYVMELDEEAKEYRRKAALLLKYAHRFGSPTFFKMADRYTEDAENAESESQRCYDWASDMEEAADYFQYEAEKQEEEETYVSGWESWLDM